MNPNSRSLALRNLPTAAVFGLVANAFGSEGGPPARRAALDDGFVGRHATGFDVGSEYAGDFGTDYGAEFGEDDMGAEFGADAAPAAMVAKAPNPNNPRHHAALMKAWHKDQKANIHTDRRTRLLNPNNGSRIKIEAYVFSLNPSAFATGTGLTWGTANGWTAFKNPQVAFRAERMFVNVNFPGVAYINTIQAANVNAQIGAIADGFTFSVYAMGSKISLPTLPPQNTMQVTGTWSTFTPPGFLPGQLFTLCVDFEGWATVTA